MRIAYEASQYLAFMPEVDAIEHFDAPATDDRPSHHHITLRARSERDAIRAIDQALALACFAEHVHLVHRGATLSSCAVLDFRPEPREPLTHPWLFSAIITDRRQEAK